MHAVRILAGYIAYNQIIRDYLQAHRLSIIATNPPHEGLLHLDHEQIDSTCEIGLWLDQFNHEDRSTARSMIRRLRFVSPTLFMNWTRDAIIEAANNRPCAIYAIRKLEPSEKAFWVSDGEVVHRPGGSLGSEDLVYSCITTVCRKNPLLLDHPSIENMRDMQVDRIILVDDSMGTGNQAAEFANRFMNNASIKSWASFEWVGLTVVSFSRLRQSEGVVQSKLPQTFRRHGALSNSENESRLKFRSRHVFDKNELLTRWGPGFESMLLLCDQCTKIKVKWRRGYSQSMSNVVFDHSVPNNIPGFFWNDTSRWKALFPGRSLPTWTQNLLSESYKSEVPATHLITEDLLELLYWVGRGLRDASSLAFKINIDVDHAIGLRSRGVQLGLVTPNKRLTKTGRDLLKNQKKISQMPLEWNQKLYIPSSWSVD